MKVFISWSKRTSMEFAIKVKNLLESIEPQIKAFVSEVDIFGGENVQGKILENIRQCDKLVICFTKENKKSPWLLFEGGYAKGCEKTVIPFLFDEDSNWHSWIDNPMNIAREIRFYSRQFPNDFLRSFGLENNSKNINMVKQFYNDILKIKEKNRMIDVECEDLIKQLISDGSFSMENPYYRDNSAFFLTGFESYELYKIITDSFLYTGKYLWIYGRRNMKLFGGSFSKFFHYLDEKALNNKLGMDGIDFRCLFLDPESNEVKYAHEEQDVFVPELTTTIARAKKIIGENDELKKCFRFYSNKREEVIIRLDNCILYSRPVFDANGIPQIMTNTGFEVFSTGTEKGKECIRKYEEIWKNARKMV